MKIVVGCANGASFINRDIRILSEKNEVKAFILRGFGIRDSFRHFRKLLAADLLLLWFATPRFIPLALLARLLRTRVAVIIGGYEAASLPEFNYGSGRRRLYAAFTRILFRLSSGISVVSESSRRSVIQNLRVSPSRVQRIYHGFDDILGSTPPIKSKLVITIGAVNRTSWEIKGIKDFLLVAELLPEVAFVHIGDVRLDVGLMLGREPAANVKFVGSIPYERLVEHLAPATIYLQLSRHESFACAVAEAMLCECIPIVSNAYALPEVVGDAGIVLPDRDIEQTAQAVKRALAQPGTLGKNARKRILNDFPLERRRDDLSSWLARVKES